MGIDPKVHMQRSQVKPEVSSELRFQRALKRRVFPFAALPVSKMHTGSVIPLCRTNLEVASRAVVNFYLLSRTPFHFPCQLGGGVYFTAFKAVLGRPPSLAEGMLGLCFAGYPQARPEPMDDLHKKGTTNWRYLIYIALLPTPRSRSNLHSSARSSRKLRANLAVTFKTQRS